MRVGENARKTTEADSKVMEEGPEQQRSSHVTDASHTEDAELGVWDGCPERDGERER
jgi:hypothetical protein